MQITDQVQVEGIGETNEYPKLDFESKDRKEMFNNKRDDLFFKTMIRDIRKFLHNDFSEKSNIKKNKKTHQLTWERFFSSLITYLESFKSYIDFGPYDPSNETLVCVLGAFVSHKEL